MVIDILASNQEWKQTFLEEIDALPHTTAKGDVFVQKVLQIYYSLSEADAVDATDCAGAGDKGVDAVYISEEDDNPLAYVVQGKYGKAGTELHIYDESQKFFNALKTAISGVSVTNAIDKIASVIKNGGLVRYVIATVEPLDNSQQKDLANIKKIANYDFADKLVVEAISLDNLYNSYTNLETGGPSLNVDLSCQVVSVQEDTYVGVASLVDMYTMLRSYATQSDNTIDSIYDHNIRKYLKRRTGSVNEGIYKTLENEPSRFIAYNNGITIVCRIAQTTAEGLHLEAPYVVNGCQTTRTLYDFMNTKFPVTNTQQLLSSKYIQPYTEAFLAIKVLVVKDSNGDAYANSITRYSNKQNAIRGKDFIALEEMYRKLKDNLKKRGYFLEIQSGEYDVLPKHKKKLYPKDTHVISSFEATLFYAASVLGKPHDTFGHSGNFMPGGERFDEVIKDLTADDLLVPWLVANTAKDNLGYTAQAKHNPSLGTEHRAQTRYLFLYLFFLLAKDVLAKLSSNKTPPRQELYEMLRAIKDDYTKNPLPDHPFAQLLTMTDEAIATYMALAEEGRWYTDRNSFLKREELIKPDRIIQATAATKLKLIAVANKIRPILSK